jgi:hypothetical protein
MYKNQWSKKVNLLRSMPWGHMGEWRYSSTIFYIDGHEWSTSSPFHFTPGEGAPDTHGIWGWVGPRSGEDAVEKRKTLHYRKSNPDRLARSISLYRLSHLDPFLKSKFISHTGSPLERWIYLGKDCFLFREVKVKKGKAIPVTGRGGP